MKTIAKIGSAADLFKTSFTNFRTRCLNPNSEILELKTDYNTMQDLFVNHRQIEAFCDRIIELSETLAAKGQTRIGDFLVNQICKLCLRFNLKDRAESFLHLAIENSRRKNDGMHELARLIDLEQLYREVNARRDLFRVLGEKKDCCKRLLETYEEQCARFDTIVALPTSRDAIKIQLAYTYSDLASLLERRRPIDALKLYEKTKDIYHSIGRTREVEYLQEKIRRIRVRNNL